MESRKVTGRQKTVLGLGLVAVIAMVLYPPWSYSAWGIGPRAAGPPGSVHIPEVEVTRTRYAPIFQRPNLWQAQLDSRRLLIQCGTVAVLTAIVVVRLR